MYREKFRQNERLLLQTILICRGAVSNVLVTSCLDNICRIWSETILPEDGVVSMSQLDPNAAQDTKFRTHR